ncbi:BrnA antitoxin family protein [Bosea sp. 47.2.35]|uniref:BrnA antitoxin family protein n=1 Tax=Bosea sp. 47.2.35 TaxID=2969304 RepID=UPI0021503558|nr:BrnA antitoxin family protein [Bosea sp. 47.2.35]MCR4524643.1 BrnA antitoxin family protein [Bosea sp. 47.2.35]
MSLHTKRTERIGLALDEEMRERIEAEARRRETSMSSVVRALIRAQLSTLQPNSLRVAG